MFWTVSGGLCSRLGSSLATQGAAGRGFRQFTGSSNRTVVERDSGCLSFFGTSSLFWLIYCLLLTWFPPVMEAATAIGLPNLPPFAGSNAIPPPIDIPPRLTVLGALRSRSGPATEIQDRWVGARRTTPRVEGFNRESRNESWRKVQFTQGNVQPLNPIARRRTHCAQGLGATQRRTLDRGLAKDAVRPGWEFLETAG